MGKKGGSRPEEQTCKNRDVHDFLLAVPMAMAKKLGKGSVERVWARHSHMAFHLCVSVLLCQDAP